MGFPESLEALEEFQARRGRPEFEQAFDAILCQLIQIAADGSFRKDDVFSTKCEVHIQMNDLRDLRSVACLMQVVNTGEPIEFLLLDLGGPVRPGAIKFALKPDVEKRETAAPEIEDTETTGNKIGLEDFRGKHSLVDVPAMMEGLGDHMVVVCWFS